MNCAHLAPAFGFFPDVILLSVFEIKALLCDLYTSLYVMERETLILKYFLRE